MLFRSSDIFLSVKQNLSHAWLLEPHALNKLMLNDIFLNDIFLSVKQNLSHAWLLGPYALGKLILNNIFLNDISEP